MNTLSISLINVRCCDGSQVEIIDGSITIGIKRRKKRRRAAMEGTILLVIAIAIPVLTFPAAFIWYLNIGGWKKAYKDRQLSHYAGK
jgi:hypothetical protein